MCRLALRSSFQPYLVFCSTVGYPVNKEEEPDPLFGLTRNGKEGSTPPAERTGGPLVAESIHGAGVNVMGRTDARPVLPDGRFDTAALKRIDGARTATHIAI